MPPVRPKKSNGASRDASTAKKPAAERLTGEAVLQHKANIRKAMEDIALKKITPAKACSLYGLKPSTLSDRRMGAQSRQQANEKQQTLTPAQEHALADYCKRKGWRREPLTLREIEKAAQIISGKEIGKCWVKRFKKRNPTLAARTTQKAESKRSQALNPQSVASFYEELEKVMKDYDIHPMDIYNADEKGVFVGGGDVKFRTLVDVKMNQASATGDENRKMVTVLECIGTNGQAIPPLLIHEGAMPDGEWIRNNPCDASMASSPNGWTSNKIAVSWIRETFEPFTHKLKRGRYRLLIIDGHVSHCSLEFICAALAHDIILLCLPPHTTHKLQPCDVGVFSFLTKTWKDAVRTAWRLQGPISKENFLHWYSDARKRAMTEERIKASFERCGIWPFDPTVVKDTDLAPAQSTSTQAAQPLPATLPDILEPVPANPNPTTSLDSPASHPFASPLVIPDGHYQLKDLPTPPGPQTSRASLLETIARLNAILDACTAQMSRDYAEKALMERENGEIRQKLYAKKGERSRVTHLVGRAQVLSSAESIQALREADRKRALGEVLKEASPLLKELQKRLANGEKEWQREQETLEKNAIKAAESQYKAAQKELADLTKKVTARQEARDNANRMRYEGAGKKTRDNNEAIEDISKLEDQIRNQTQLTEEVEVPFRDLVKRRAERVAALAEKEKGYVKAIEQEERAKKGLQPRSAEREAYIATAPKKVRDPLAHWSGKVAERPQIRRENKENQHDIRILQPQDPVVPVAGPSRRPEDDIREIECHSPQINAIPIDPELFQVDIDYLGRI